MNDNKPKSVNEKELETLSFWKEKKIFESTLEKPAGENPKGSFSFYDGPPFATGLPHHGSLMAGTVKDLIPRYQTMKGNTVRRMWGWDCHGLPIENLIEKKLGLSSKKDIEEFGIDKFNRDAYESVLQYEREWKEIIPRMGRWVDMESPYKTMDATYTESIWWAWKTLYEKKLAYEGHKMMHICPRCETPLAQSEVGLEYHDVTDLSVTVKFELDDEPGTYVLAWTTTPWTLPGNTALALKEDAMYEKISKQDVEGFFIVAKARAKEIFGSDGEGTKWKVVEKIPGKDLVGKKYHPPFNYFKDADIEHKEKIWRIWHADFITLDTGTGIAHEAPAFGADDMELAKLHKIPVIKHVKMDGTFTQDVGDDLAGMKVKVVGDTKIADKEIKTLLKYKGLLFESHSIVHSYPLCWRCKTPLLNYATSSWFVDVPKMKEKLIKENQKIGWTPEHIRDGRFGKWLEGAREWAVSRSRYWGAPLPVWKNADGSKIKVIGSLEELASLSKTKPRNTYYVMRHGEAISNVEGFMDKGTNMKNHLTKEGQVGVRASAENLKDKKIDVIIASPVLRGKETAEIVGDVLGLPVTFDKRLTENDMGIFDGKSREEYFASFSTSFVTFDARPEGGETHREMMHRVMAAIHDYEKLYEEKNILIVTHGGPVRMLLAGAKLLTEEQVVRDEEEEGANLYPKNAEVRKVELKIVPRDETGAINLHRPYIDDVVLLVDGEEYRRIGDVFDCWYESGAMPFASLHYPFENKEVFNKNYPADFIAESLDQTRGWFYSLINLGVGLFDKAPYRHVICNGLINAADGKKLSKSLQNYTDPLLLVEKYGADAFRLYLMSSPVVKGEMINFSDKELDEMYKKCILRLDNVMQLYALGLPEGVKPSTTSTYPLDVWMISRVHELVRSATKGYDTYALDEATKGIEGIIDDISVWYTRRSRARLKGDAGDKSRQEAYETFTYVLLTLAKTIAPVMPFIAERVYKGAGGERESVHLENWPEVGEINEEVLSTMKKVRTIVSSALMERTQAKIGVRQPLTSVSINDATILEEEYIEIMKEELNVKEVIVKEKQTEVAVLDTTITEELRKEGDMRQLMRAVQDARKDAGLVPSDDIVLYVAKELPFGDPSLLLSTCKIARIVIEEKEGSKDVQLSDSVVTFVIAKV